MPSINTVTLVGSVTEVPETRVVNGSTVTDLGLAVSEQVKRDGEWTEDVSRFRVAVWGKQGEACAERLGKGSQVAVAGRLKQEAEGVKVVAQSVQFLTTDSVREAVPA